MAERKRLKNDSGATPPPSSSSSGGKSDPPKERGSRPKIDYRDHAHYIEDAVTYDREGLERSQAVEAAMQPSASSRGQISGASAAAVRLEESALDLIGDEAADMVMKSRMMRWDKSKRKYIQTTVGAELSGESWSKRTKLESGKVVRANKLEPGAIYEKWQKKTKRSVGRVGVFDDVTAEGEGGFEDSGAAAFTGAGRDSAAGGKGGDGTRSVSLIRKERAAKKDMMRKNMKKEDRKRLERKDKNEKIEMMRKNDGKGFQGKKGFSGKWGASQKGPPKKGNR